MDGILDIPVTLSRSFKSIEILPISDTHIGDVACDFKLLQNNIKYIKEHKNCYTILNGDIMNMALKSSVSNIYSEKVDPMEQIERMTEIFAPIQNKILAICTGNHEERVYRNDGIDVTKIVANNLKCLDRYFQTAYLIFLRVGQESRGRKETSSDEIRQITYTIYGSHGKSGGRTTGAKANALHRQGDITNADINIISHTHMPIIFKDACFEVDARNNTHIKKERLYVNTNAYLDYAGYGVTAGFRPASLSCPVIYLDGTKKEFTAKL